MFREIRQIFGALAVCEPFERSVAETRLQLVVVWLRVHVFHLLPLLLEEVYHKGQRVARAPLQQLRKHLVEHGLHSMLLEVSLCSCRHLRFLGVLNAALLLGLCEAGSEAGGDGRALDLEARDLDILAHDLAAKGSDASEAHLLRPHLPEDVDCVGLGHLVLRGGRWEGDDLACAERSLPPRLPIADGDVGVGRQAIHIIDRDVHDSRRPASPPSCPLCPPLPWRHNGRR
mmetsp:Transcript_1430/g.3225  ORF Transcript_1430/g.3225 Transcript_1430/m.3225 type:complete len:230 (-) Transcript_1430:16-705(-)